MSSAFSTITAAIVTALNVNPAISANIYRARDRQISDEMASAINVQFDGSEPTQGAILGAPVDWRSRITVECYSRSNTLSGDLSVDPILVGVYARLAADTTLGGLVMDIGEPMIEADCDAQGQKTGWVRMTYIILHRTNNLTLE